MLTGRYFEHVEYTGSNGKPLNGLLRHPGGNRTRLAVFVHGLAGKPLGGNPFVGPMSDFMYHGGVGLLLPEYGGTGAESWFGPHKGGATFQTVEASVRDVFAATKAGMEAGYDSVRLVGYSLGSTVVAMCAVLMEAEKAVDLAEVNAIAPTRMPAWMSAIDNRHQQLLMRAEKMIRDGRGDELVVSDHRGFDMAFSANAYRSLSRADIVPLLGAISAPIQVIYGTQDEHVNASYGGDLKSTLLTVNPDLHFDAHWADHSFSGYEIAVAASARVFSRERHAIFQADMDLLERTRQAHIPGESYFRGATWL